MTKYKSLNNQVIISRSVIPRQRLSKSILEDLLDPISGTILKNPVVLTSSGYIYDYDNIQQWFIKSYVESIAENILAEIKFIPVKNYQLLLLCLELDNDKLYFHPPVGDLLNLLELVGSLRYLKDVPISLNLNDYHDKKISYGPLNLTTFTFQPLTLYDILGYCPVTRKSLLSNCYLSDRGYFVHASLSNFQRQCAHSGRLSGFNFTTKIMTKPVNNQKLLSKLGLPVDNSLCFICDKLDYYQQQINIKYVHLHSKFIAINLNNILYNDNIGFNCLSSQIILWN